MMNITISNNSKNSTCSELPQNASPGIFTISCSIVTSFKKIAVIKGLREIQLEVEQEINVIEGSAITLDYLKKLDKRKRNTIACRKSRQKKKLIQERLLQELERRERKNLFCVYFF